MADDGAVAFVRAPARFRRQPPLIPETLPVGEGAGRLPLGVKRVDRRRGVLIAQAHAADQDMRLRDAEDDFTVSE